jgi:nucleotide-binding universal stress UspA family protein
MKIKSVLVASHGTAGAVAAEKVALDLCGEKGARLHHFVVVPDFWKGMTGDDWLNNAASRIRYGRYVENELQREIAEHAAKLADAAEKLGIPFGHSFALGKPAECLIEAAKAGKYDLVVIGSPRPKGTPGFRSRMAVETLAKGLGLPFLVVPHPGR